MPKPTYTSSLQSYNITFYPESENTKPYPGILLLHGNGAFRPPFGDQIHRFAEALAKLGYVTAVPGYYPDDDPPNPLQNPDQDPHPHVQKLADATTEFSKRDDVDATKLGLIGYSLGAAVAMRYMAANPKKVTVFADFFGLIDPTIRAGTGTFPPTIIFHTDGDRPVPISHSRTLRDDLAAKPIEHHLQEYPPEPGQFLNHPFIPGGYADGDSQKRLIEWFAKYLPPEKS